MAEMADETALGSFQTLVGTNEAMAGPKSLGKGPPGKLRASTFSGSGAAKTVAVAATRAQRRVLRRYMVDRVVCLRSFF